MSNFFFFDDKYTVLGVKNKYILHNIKPSYKILQHVL